MMKIWDRTSRKTDLWFICKLFSTCFLFHLESRTINTFLLRRAIRHNNRILLWEFPLNSDEICMKTIFSATPKFCYFQLNTIIGNNSSFIWSSEVCGSLNLIFSNADFGNKTTVQPVFTGKIWHQCFQCDLQTVL